MALTNLDRIFKVEETEYGNTLKAQKPVQQGKTIEIYIPKLMGIIKGIGNEALNTSGLFLNAPDCKIVVGTSIKKKNTISAKLQKNCDWLGKLDKSGNIPANTLFFVNFIHSNIQEPTITTL